MHPTPPALARLASWTVALGAILGILALPLLLLVWAEGGGPQLNFIFPGQVLRPRPPLALSLCAALLGVAAGALRFVVAPRLSTPRAALIVRVAVVVSVLSQLTLLVCWALIVRAEWSRMAPVSALP